MRSAEKITHEQRSSQHFKDNLLQNMEQYFKLRKYKQLPSDYYSVHTLIKKDDQHRIKFQKIFQQMEKTKKFNPQTLGLTSKESRGLATLLGLAICDALGATTEFIDFDKSRKYIKKGFSDIENLIKEKLINHRCGRTGIWTDDASMALAMAYSVLINNYKFDPIHTRYMFVMWLEHGLGNGGRQHSIGLGGNISISMSEFMYHQTQYAETGNQFNNGNGSLMRLAPIPLAFSDNIEKAVQYSGNQSLTTHNGIEAYSCAKLLATILVSLMNRKQDENWRTVLDEACQSFETQNKSVKFLAESKPQTIEMYKESVNKYKGAFVRFNRNVNDRNWNWKDKDFTYSLTRYQQQPGYIGSYCMDALSMALHTVWHTKSFKQCAILNANYGGDCDTVGAIAGQICGAIYGVDQDMLKLYSEMVDWTEGRYEVFLVGYKLATKKRVMQNHKNQENVEEKVEKGSSMGVSTNNDTINDSQMQIQQENANKYKKI